MSATTARQSVLNSLRNANLDGLQGLTVSTLGIMTGYPEPTIRRTLGELKRVFTIVREGKRVRLVA